MPSGDAVRLLHGAMQQQKVPVVKPLYEDPALVSFRCTDPDGHTIEIYWQAPRNSG